MLLVEHSQKSQADFRYRIFNADGQEVEQCGNGVRCVGEFLCRQDLHNGQGITLDTNAGLIVLYREENDLWRVDMGKPEFEPQNIPLSASGRQTLYTVSMSSAPVEFMAVSMGNPHAVLQVDDVDQAEVERLGPLVQSHGIFPQGVNVGFMEIVDSMNIRLRVYERGVGETDACGTGACAAVATGINAGRLESEVAVSLRGGDLKIKWDGEGQSLWMTGPAVTVYEGQIEI